MIANLLDRIVQPPQSFRDALAGHLAGQLVSGLQAEAHLEEAADYAVEMQLHPAPRDGGTELVQSEGFRGLLVPSAGRTLARAEAR